MRPASDYAMCFDPAMNEILLETEQLRHYLASLIPWCERLERLKAAIARNEAARAV